MKNDVIRFIRNSLIGGDLLVINLAFLIGYLIKFRHFGLFEDDKYLVLFLVFNLAWLVATYLLSAYSQNRIIDFDNYFFKIIRIVLLHTLLITAFWVARKAFYYSREQMLWTYICLYPMIVVWRGLFFYFVKRYRKSGRHIRKVVLAGVGEVGKQLIEVFERNKDYGYEVVGVFATTDPGSKKYEGAVSSIEQFVKNNEVDEIHCSVSEVESDQVKWLSSIADDNIIRLRLIPDVSGVGFKRLNMEFFEHVPLLSLRNLPLDSSINRFLKRVFDILFSLLIIVFVLSWLYPMMAILIKAGSKGPVLFKQKRSGLNNEEFDCFKFRSMRVNDRSDQQQATRRDSRVTPIGRFIRKTSIDELPQFFNVLKGEMSVVGPRPHMLKHTEEYSALIERYMVRHFVKPGITGLAQVKGYRGETKDPKLMERRIRLDMLYVESWSFLLDVWIILRTGISLFTESKKAF